MKVGGPARTRGRAAVVSWCHLCLYLNISAGMLQEQCPGAAAQNAQLSVHRVMTGACSKQNKVPPYRYPLSWELCTGREGWWEFPMASYMG